MGVWTLGFPSRCIILAHAQLIFANCDLKGKSTTKPMKAVMKHLKRDPKIMTENRCLSKY
jgi:hypothetical protein